MTEWYQGDTAPRCRSSGVRPRRGVNALEPLGLSRFPDRRDVGRREPASGASAGAARLEMMRPLAELRDVEEPA